MESNRIAIVKSTTFHVLYEVDHEERDALSVHLDTLRFRLEIASRDGRIRFSPVRSHLKSRALPAAVMVFREPQVKVFPESEAFKVGLIPACS